MELKKFKQAYDKIIAENAKQNFDNIKPIFEKEIPELLKKLNDFFKKQGLQCYFTAVGNVYYYAGYRQKLKFHAEGDPKGRSWYEWTCYAENISTKNLVYKHESDNEACLKDTYRSESHRGQVVNLF